MVSKAQIDARTRWERKAYDKILLRLRKDTEPTRDSIASAANERGESMNEYIVNAIKNRLHSTGAKEPRTHREELEHEPFIE